VGEVVVVDDGSSDGTPAAAAAAGARVLVAPRGMGKGAALEGALRRLPPADVYVLVDGDVGESASAMAPLLEDVVGGRADLAIAVPPPPPRGGFGLVKGSARLVVQALTGFAPRAPLSGQRVVTARAMAACRPLARGFGVETAMTLDVLRSGYRVVEVPAAIGHRFTGRDVRGFAHRARQGLDAARAAIPRLLRLR
jgi:glycosyltransferase involved in cell wall biosynthesis